VYIPREPPFCSSVYFLHSTSHNTCTPLTTHQTRSKRNNNPLLKSQRVSSPSTADQPPRQHSGQFPRVPPYTSAYLAIYLPSSTPPHLPVRPPMHTHSTLESSAAESLLHSIGPAPAPRTIPARPFRFCASRMSVLPGILAQRFPPPRANFQNCRARARRAMRFPVRRSCRSRPLLLPSPQAQAQATEVGRSRRRLPNHGSHVQILPFHSILLDAPIPSH
jgi:hypothetical protein